MTNPWFSEALMRGMVRGTLVEYKESAVHGAEFARGTIVEAEFDPTEFEGRGRLTLKSDSPALFVGSVENVRDFYRTPGGVFFFFDRAMRVHYAFAPPGVTIPDPKSL